MSPQGIIINTFSHVCRWMECSISTMKDSQSLSSVKISLRCESEDHTFFVGILWSAPARKSERRQRWGWNFRHRQNTVNVQQSTDTVERLFNLHGIADTVFRHWRSSADFNRLVETLLKKCTASLSYCRFRSFVRCVKWAVGLLPCCAAFCDMDLTYRIGLDVRVLLYVFTSKHTYWLGWTLILLFNETVVRQSKLVTDFQPSFVATLTVRLAYRSGLLKFAML